MSGLRTYWEIGPRSLIEGRDHKGKTVTRLGKNGGPVIEQHIVKVIEPRESR